jgi:hypothetical protein
MGKIKYPAYAAYFAIVSIVYSLVFIASLPITVVYAIFQVIMTVLGKAVNSAVKILDKA